MRFSATQQLPANAEAREPLLNIQPLQFVAALPAGSYYHHQILGLLVEEPSGVALGRAVDILHTGAGAPVLVVRSNQGESFAPLAGEFVKSVDLAAGRIVAVRPELVDAED